MNMKYSEDIKLEISGKIISGYYTSAKNITKDLNRLIKSVKVENKVLNVVNKLYDDNKFSPPFRVGKKSKKSVLDSNGLQLTYFEHSENQAKMYVDYLNNIF